MMGDGLKQLCDEETGGFVVKMGKSIYPSRNLPAGTILERSDLSMKAPATGMYPYEKNQVVGKELAKDIGTEAPIKMEDLK